MSRKPGVLAMVLAVFMFTLVTGGLSAAPPPGYILGPEDTIEILVWGEPRLTTTVTIRPDGTVTLPLIGDMRAAGFTPEEFAQSAQQALTRYLQAPRVQVTVRTFRPQKVYILGEVNRAGEFVMGPGQGIAEVLAAAGGPTPRADLRKAVIVRRQTEMIPVDLSVIMAGGAAPVRFQPGDVLIIPQAERRVVILGQVTRPGTYEIREGDRLSDLLSLAGGPGPRAALRRATIVRGRQNIAINLEAVLASASPEVNLVLQPGDLVLVPEFQHRVAVLGSVGRPGAYELREGDRLLDLLALAGVDASTALLDEVGVVRQVGGKPVLIKINATKALRAADASQNPSLENGDVVFVPGGRVNWTTVLSWLTGLGLLKGLFGL